MHPSRVSWPFVKISDLSTKESSAWQILLDVDVVRGCQTSVLLKVYFKVLFFFFPPRYFNGHGGRVAGYESDVRNAGM